MGRSRRSRVDRTSSQRCREERPTMCERCDGLSRRGLLGAMAATLVAAAGPAPPATITGEQALHRLMAGNARYRANQTHARDFAVDRAARVATHRPIASVLSCSD